MEPPTFSKPCTGKECRTIGADLITTGARPRHGAVMIVQTLIEFAMISQGKM